MKKIMNTAFQALVALIVIMPAVTVQAETIDCTPVTSLPATISTQGVHCLTGHLASNLATGNAITITVNNVIIDLNGYKIGNLAAGSSTTAKGIYAYRRQNITIMNGIIRGFEYGIHLDDISPWTTSQGNLIQHIRADQNHTIGLQIEGRGNVIRKNAVVDIGGSDNSVQAYGIMVYGPGALVQDNKVYEIKEQAGGIAYGIHIQSEGGIVWNNAVGNAATGPGTSTAIYISSSNDVLVRNNHITKMNFGIFYSSSNGKYMDNLTSGIPTAGNRFTGGTSVGDNN